MLKKLFKYDMIALSRYLIPLHILMLIVSLLGRFLVTSRLLNTPPPLVVGIILFTYISVMIVVCSATYLIIAVYFYKNLFTHEGYLTLTLPASPVQHLNAKTLSGILWLIIDLAVIALSLVLLLMTPATMQHAYEFGSIFQQQFGIAPTTYLIYIAAFLLLGALTSPLIIYVCIAIGQLFSNHRILGAVVVYFVFTMLLQFVMTACLILSGALPFSFNYSGLTLNYNIFFDIGLKISIVWVILEGVFSYFVTLHILKKKINLI